MPFWEISDHAVCDLLKLYFRTLPESLLTEELYDCFTAKASISITQKVDVDLAGLLQTLPNNNRYLLKRLLLLLKRVCILPSVCVYARPSAFDTHFVACR